MANQIKFVHQNKFGLPTKLEQSKSSVIIVLSLAYLISVFTFVLLISNKNGDNHKLDDRSLRTAFPYLFDIGQDLDLLEDDGQNSAIELKNGHENLNERNGFLKYLDKIWNWEIYKPKSHHEFFQNRFNSRLREQMLKNYEAGSFDQKLAEIIGQRRPNRYPQKRIPDSGLNTINLFNEIYHITDDAKLVQITTTTPTTPTIDIDIQFIDDNTRIDGDTYNTNKFKKGHLNEEQSAMEDSKSTKLTFEPPFFELRRSRLIEEDALKMFPPGLLPVNQKSIVEVNEDLIPVPSASLELDKELAKLIKLSADVGNLVTALA